MFCRPCLHATSHLPQFEKVFRVADRSSRCLHAWQHLPFEDAMLNITLLRFVVLTQDMLHLVAAVHTIILLIYPPSVPCCIPLWDLSYFVLLVAGGIPPNAA